MTSPSSLDQHFPIPVGACLDNASLPNRQILAADTESVSTVPSHQRQPPSTPYFVDSPLSDLPPEENSQLIDTRHGPTVCNASAYISTQHHNRSTTGNIITRSNLGGQKPTLTIKNPSTMSPPPQDDDKVPVSPNSKVPLSYTSNAFYVPPKTGQRTKPHVASACVNCKKKHLGCDSGRPCRRCVAAHLEGTCVDGQHAKRGRPPLRGKGESDRFGGKPSRARAVSTPSQPQLECASPKPHGHPLSRESLLRHTNSESYSMLGGGPHSADDVSQYDSFLQTPSEIQSPFVQSPVSFDGPDMFSSPTSVMFSLDAQQQHHHHQNAVSGSMGCGDSQPSTFISSWPISNPGFASTGGPGGGHFRSSSTTSAQSALFSPSEAASSPLDYFHPMLDTGLQPRSSFDPHHPSLPQTQPQPPLPPTFAPLQTSYPSYRQSASEQQLRLRDATDSPHLLSPTSPISSFFSASPNDFQQTQQCDSVGSNDGHTITEEMKQGNINHYHHHHHHHHHHHNNSSSSSISADFLNNNTSMSNDLNNSSNNNNNNNHNVHDHNDNCYNLHFASPPLHPIPSAAEFPDIGNLSHHQQHHQQPQQEQQQQQSHPQHQQQPQLHLQIGHAPEPLSLPYMDQYMSPPSSDSSLAMYKPQPVYPEFYPQLHSPLSPPPPPPLPLPLQQHQHQHQQQQQAVTDFPGDSGFGSSPTAAVHHEDSCGFSIYQQQHPFYETKQTPAINDM